MSQDPVCRNLMTDCFQTPPRKRRNEEEKHSTGNQRTVKVSFLKTDSRYNDPSNQFDASLLSEFENFVSSEALSLTQPVHSYAQHSSLSPMKSSEGVVRSVLKFRRLSDRAMSLGSVLLKSKAYYYQTSSKRMFGTKTLTSTEGSARAVVELPRSPYKKPYIPECDEGILSVSHQGGYVGYAHLLTDDESFSSSPLKVGFDIVVIDRSSFGGGQASSTREILHPFRDSFTKTEWRCVCAGSKHDKEQGGVAEFFIRWSMKEAYTKALGMGMGVPFDSFDIVPLLNDNKGEHVLDTDHCKSVYDFIVENGYETDYDCHDAGAKETIMCHIQCKVVPDPFKNVVKKRFSKEELLLCSQEEIWSFWFIDLDKKPNLNLAASNYASGDETHNMPFHLAVGCVAVGPFVSLEEIDASQICASPKLEIERESFESLISFHNNGIYISK